MKNLKVKMSMLAIVLGFAGAFASSAHGSFSNKTWGKESTGAYVDVTGQLKGTDYRCTGTTDVCTAVYPASQDPNLNPANPIGIVAGTFSN